MTGGAGQEAGSGDDRPLARVARRLTLFEKAPAVTSAFSWGIRHDTPSGAPLRLTWSDIAAVRLAFAPTRFKRNRYEFNLLDRRGRSMLEVDNIHFRGVADFVEQNADFNAFVIAVATHLPQNNPDARLYAGASALSYGLQGGFALVALLVLLAVVLNLALPGAILSGLTLVKLGLIIVSLPLLLKWFVKARPQGLDWSSDLSGYLPKST